MTSAIAGWYAGTTRQVVTTVKDIQGALVSLTGATAKFALVKSLSSTLAVSKTVGDGIVITESSSLVTVTLDPADSTDLSGDYQMQLEVTLGNGVVLMAYDVIVTIKKNFAKEVV